MTRSLLSTAWMALVLGGCRGNAHDHSLSLAAEATAGNAAPPPPAADAGAGDEVDAAARPLPPLPGFFEALPVEGHADAWISLPTGATGKRPVVVLIHGMGDRPDWQCGGWRRATGEWPFVVCPRGDYAPRESTKDDLRYTHRGGAALLATIDASLAALEARYPGYVDASTPVLAGFSLGAAQVVALAVEDPSRFPRLALIEGATNSWTDERVRQYAAGGGQRVLFGTGQRVNEEAAKKVAKRLTARGLETQVVFAPVHHTFEPPLEDAVHEQLEWLVEGDARWAR